MKTTVGDVWRKSSNEELADLMLDYTTTLLCHLFDIPADELFSKYLDSESHYYMIKEYFNTDVSKTMSESEYIS